jgi:hypothetical protein
MNYQLPRGSRVTAGYTRNRDQAWGRSTIFRDQFRVDNFDGTLTTKDLLTLGGYFVLLQSADQQLALDVRAGYARDRFRSGQLDVDSWLDGQDPFLGFRVSNLKFHINEDNFKPLGLDVFDPSDEFVMLIRSGGATQEQFQFYPKRDDLAVTQSLAGLGDQSLRANPFGWRTNVEIRGPGNGGLQVRREDRLQLRGSVDWQIGRFNRLKAGAEWVDVDLSSTTIPLFDEHTIPEVAQPTRIGAFLQDRFDIGDLVLEGGIRWDYLDPNVTLSRVPGFTFSVPDSLQKGFVKVQPDGSIGLKWEGDNCGGVTALNPNGTCITNFLETDTKSEFSPRLGASFPVTPTSTFRLSYGRFVQMPAFFTGATVFANSPGTANAVVGFLQSSSNDFALNANTNDRFARDVELPSTRTFEFGYRQLIGTSLVLDVAAFNKKQRGGLAYRKELFEEPLFEGAFRNVTVAANADFTESNGFEVKVDHSIGNLLWQSLTYSFIDARGTGSDEETFVGLIFRATSNVSAVLQQPVNAPELLLPLEMSRQHNISWTGSLQFPQDYMEGTAAGAILRDFGVFAVLRVRSGLPFTLVQQSGRGFIGPPSRSDGPAPASNLSALRTPWRTEFDIRATKGFRFAGVQGLVFADWRNPFDLEDREVVFLETGNDVNEQARSAFLTNALLDSRLDGEQGTIDDFDIKEESTENTFNKFMLLRAEERFGDGDGVFTVEEQNVAFGQLWEATRGLENVFRISNQSLRLGVRLSF